MKIYFTRHGESQANLLHVISNRQLPHGLTEAGRVQAAQLAERLQGKPITCIYSSPLLRAVETSSILARQLRVDFEMVDGLREFDCGIAEGRGDEHAWQLWQEEYDAWVKHRDYDYCIQGGESFYEVRERFQGFIDRLVNINGDTSKEYVCVSHGGIYSVLFPIIMTNVTTRLMEERGFHYTSCIEADYQAGALVCTAWDGQPVDDGEAKPRE